MTYWFDNDNDSKRTLGIRDKQILYRKANKRCENPKCNKEIEFHDMQVGHKKAWSKGGRTTFKNSVCLCYGCNKLQGTDSWTVFLKKQGVEDKTTSVKESLETLSINQLKSLTKKHHIKVNGKVEDDYRKAPTKKQYISKLMGVVSEKEINSLPNELSLKESLETLSISQLKSLAEKHHIKVKGKVEEDSFNTYRKAPTKKQYISKLMGIVSEKEINSLPKEVPKVKKKKKGNRSEGFWG